MTSDALVSLVAALVNGATELTTLALRIADHLQQSGELTDEQSKALDAKIDKLNEQPWWKPDPPK